MYVGDWVECGKEELDEFFTWYMEMHEQDPEQFPVTMNAGEWDEQFRVWGSM